MSGRRSSSSTTSATFCMAKCCALPASAHSCSLPTESKADAARGRGRPRHTQLFGINPQIYIHRRPRIELTHRFGVALVPIELCVDFVINTGGKRGEAVNSVLPGDERLHRARAGI